MAWAQAWEVGGGLQAERGCVAGPHARQLGGSLQGGGAEGAPSSTVPLTRVLQQQPEVKGLSRGFR